MRKMLCGILTGALVLCAAAGCSQAPLSSTTSGQENPQPPTEISVGFWNVEECLVGDAVQQYIEAKFNVRFVPVSFNYDNYPQRLQQMAANDNLPDIFAHDIYGSSAYESWISHNKVRALPKDLTAYPNLAAYLDQPYCERFMRTDGRYYAIPRLTYSEEESWVVDRCLVARKDWMEKLGLGLPESWEEYVELLRQFTEGDPDGDGQHNTVGMTCTHLNTLEAVYLSLFPELSNTERGWMYENDRWIPVYMSEKTGPALEAMRDLYHQGLLDPNFAYISTNEAIESFIEGQVGVIASQYHGIIKEMRAQGYSDDEIQRRVCILPPWPAADGQRYRFTTSLHWSESYFGANVSEEKMAKILKIYDWLLTDEFEEIRNYGLPGEDYCKAKDGSVQVLDEKQYALGKYPSLTVFGSLAEWNQDGLYAKTPGNFLNYGQQNVEAARAYREWSRNNTVRVNYNFSIIFLSTPAKNNLIANRDVQSEMVKVILGEENAVTAWPKALERLRGITPLDEAVAEVTALAKEMGVKP
ncbi:extracellular solute-binding protein [Allofournierella sp.]|uniref:extracellular solute-binding protein n=1 Tax=Allofournierella sp. TaxID=1940256 RepID=UPI003AB10A5D